MPPVVNCGQASQPQNSNLKSLPVFKPQQVDPQKEYPCPCCRGQINPLVLMEAWGCARCQKIFALRDNDCTLEQVSTPHLYSWQWNGQGWRSTKSIPTSTLRLYLATLLSLALFLIGSWYFWLDRRVHKPSTQPLLTENQDL